MLARWALSEVLLQSKEYKPVAFIDDTKDLNKQHINGVKVHSAKHIELLIHRYSVNEILLAPSLASRQRRNEIINLVRATSSSCVDFAGCVCTCAKQG